jgi:dTDP-4-dehydrorhamnose reductase
MSQNKPSALVTGASGFLGGHLCKAASGQYQVYGSYNSNATLDDLYLPGRCDLTDYQSVVAMLDHVKPEVVFHLAALSQPNLCAENPQLSKKINLDAAINLAGLCGDRNIKFIFTSTDLVFDGVSGSYTEASPVNPINHYGEHKALAEEGVLDRYADAVVCRMPLMYGRAKSFLGPMLSSLQSQVRLSLFTDEFRSIASATCASQGLLLAKDMAKGLLHLGGPDRLSRFEIGQLLVRKFQFSEKLLKPVLQRELTFAAARPADVSLVSDLASSQGYQPRAFTQVLEEDY